MANTGKKIIISLQETLGGTPTGDVKNNLPDDPDYIAPYTDLADCPIIYTTECPVVKFTKITTTLEYEFSLPNSVVNNPVIAKINVVLSPGAITQSFVLPNTPSPNYFHDTFTGLDSGTTYTVAVEYLDDADSVIATC